MTVYRSGLGDSTRWAGFAFRPGDIVISTPSKCGTTWAQMICALLVFGTPDLPAPLTTLSPWLDMRLRPLPDVLDALAAQPWRRFVKTHTPLDGLPPAPGVTYLVVGRDPRDVAVSMDHHRANLSPAVVGSPDPARPTDRRERVLAWLHDDRPPAETLDSLRGLVWHLAGAWERRADPAVVLVHHADLTRDLPAAMRLIAARLGIDVPPPAWPALVEAASFATMRARAAKLAPDERLGLFTDPGAFFRSGAAGQWRALLTPADLDAYDRRLRSLAGPDLAAWLTHGVGEPPTAD